MNSFVRNFAPAFPPSAAICLQPSYFGDSVQFAGVMRLHPPAQVLFLQFEFLLGTQMQCVPTTPLPLHQQHKRHRNKTRFNWHIRQPMYGERSLVAKNHLIAAIGEYIGTLLFLMLAFGGTTVANIPSTNITDATAPGQNGAPAAAPNTSNLLYIAFSFGIALMVCVFIFFRVAGGLFNPAVSLGMLLAGAVTPLRAVVLVVSQLLGGISGAALIEALLPGTLNVRTLKGGGISTARALWLEAFLTGVLMLTILLVAAKPNRAKHLAPIAIGFALFVCELVGVYYTGGSLNPARSFGPAVVVTEFSNYHWIYWLGPAIGTTIAAGLYRLLRILEYETCMGPEPEECAHGNYGVSRTQSAHDSDMAPGTSHNRYLVEGTSFGQLLERDVDDMSDEGHDHHQAQYQARFDRLEGMMAQLLEAGQYRGGTGIGATRSSGEHSCGRKASMAGTLVEEPHREKTPHS
ncbi:hypothetical protein JCM11251_004570 [Rhodosporidiobolus azoricus]